MVGGLITSEKGIPIVSGKQLSPSAYNPKDEVKMLFARCQSDYQRAWALQNRSFDEFDGMSLLQRAKLDQQTFAAYVGAEFIPSQKRWRWRGRKNTARNKLIGILAHMIAGMLYPYVKAQNSEDEEDKMTARVMRIIVEEKLRKANYELKFLYMGLSALVNPAVFVEVDYVLAYQRIKERLANGSYKVTEAIDELLTGLALNVIPIDQVLLADFYTSDIQQQPYIIRVERISWDMARKIYGESPNFKYVEAGKTRVFIAGADGQTLFDIEWTEADQSAVQVITLLYRDEDLEVCFVGGVFMGSEDDVYNSNPFKHRRMSLIGSQWKTIPIYKIAKSGFEPLDPSGRFAYYKSGAFKEFWDDAAQNRAHQLWFDAMQLDVMKPLFISGLAKADSNIIAPGAVVGMPKDAQITPWSMGSNLPAAINVMQKEEQDMSESTQDKIMSGITEPNVTATQSIQAQNQARIFLGVFGIMVSDLIRQIGDLTKDCIIQHTLEGEVDASIPESLNIKYKTLLAKSKDKGKDVTNKIIFTSALMGKTMTEAEVKSREYALYEKAGGEKSDQRIYEVNPYRFARTMYSFYVDPQAITDGAFGLNRQMKITNHQMLTSPAVYPYTDPKAVADIIIEEFGGDDPDTLKVKVDPNQMMGGMGMGQPSPIQMQGSEGRGSPFKAMQNQMA